MLAIASNCRSRSPQVSTVESKCDLHDASRIQAILHKWLAFHRATLVPCVHRAVFASDTRATYLAYHHYVSLVRAATMCSDEPFSIVVLTFRTVGRSETTRMPIPARVTNRQKSGTLPDLKLGTIMNTQSIEQTLPLHVNRTLALVGGYESSADPVAPQFVNFSDFVPKHLQSYGSLCRLGLHYSKSSRSAGHQVQTLTA
jgi:hypothetical protein